MCYLKKNAGGFQEAEKRAKKRHDRFGLTHKKSGRSAGRWSAFGSMVNSQ